MKKIKLDVAQLSELDQENHYFTIDTFRGGDYPGFMPPSN